MFRTDGGLSTPAPDNIVYLRRFKYTTLESFQKHYNLGQISLLEKDVSSFAIASAPSLLSILLIAICNFLWLKDAIKTLKLFDLFSF
jgi:hypothetical protein